ncbi:MAG: sterol desaturase family protein [Okeania sp. SIO3B5]|uniref:sterol desaturase family protein n=1 Tax=Okeania sp. SIO3B5 TaxID=2607811 RepID=UPI0013FEA204|nr:sterol desaturase family protein [Okeania sp. SIO3B5]NEO52610.1 sterol desaturase family protein [Okeania sp. SIO3B5]
MTIALFYQVFLHTETIPKLGWFEGKLLNTPASHRVHHGCNPNYLNKNYGNMLIIFDRIFGTYEPEQEKVKYGVGTESINHNPLRVVLDPIGQCCREYWQIKTSQV